MANPKKKTPRAKRDMRRSHHALTAPVLTTCKTCGAAKRPHFECSKCSK